MAHGCQKGALGTVGFVGTFLGGAQLIEQLASFADVDPAADDALDFAGGVAVGQYPVVDRQFFAIDEQGAIKDQRVASSATTRR